MVAFKKSCTNKSGNSALTVLHSFQRSILYVPSCCSPVQRLIYFAIPVVRLVVGFVVLLDVLQTGQSLVPDYLLVLTNGLFSARFTTGLAVMMYMVRTFFPNLDLRAPASGIRIWGVNNHYC